MRQFGAFLCFIIAHLSPAQFPFLRPLEIKSGQQRPAIHTLAQDSIGLLWAGSDLGLFRSDGERTDLVLRTDGSAFDVLSSQGLYILAAAHNGVVFRCSQQGCDTLFADSTLMRTPVRDMVMLGDGSLLMATYGAGLWRLLNGEVKRWRTHDGLPDDHVNAVELLPDGRAVLATDQGLAVFANNAIQQVFDGQRGVPDNLVLSLAVAPDGTVHAGTHGRGVFAWVPGSQDAMLLDSAWDRGPVTSVSVVGDQVWVGTEDHGVVLYRAHDPAIRYSSPSMFGAVRDLQVDAEGAVWWCDGSHLVHRADPSVLLVPDHEGLDLRGISAICADMQDRIWFATDEGLFVHTSAFSIGERLRRVALNVDPRTPIVSLAAGSDGRIWAATFGSGVFAVLPSGQVTQYTAADGLGNDNVLSVRASGERIWCATLGGVAYWDGQRFQQLQGTSGFTFDILSDGDSSLFIATDGHGILHWNGERTVAVPSPSRTYYALAPDAQGVSWAIGPGTGLCRITDTLMHCTGAGRDLFQQDLYALASSRGRLLVFGGAGVLSMDPITGEWSDLTSRFGLKDMQAQLKVLANTSDGALWFGCDKGLVRIEPSDDVFSSVIPVLFTGVLINGVDVGAADHVDTDHDRNDIVVRFTALHYTDPGALRFEYRMGPSGEVLRTRDRELAFMDLAPGVHHVQFRAQLGEVPGQGPWRTLTVVVQGPWWERPWLIALVVCVLATIIFLVVRGRERRMRERQQLEQDKVRFQLDALRSQIDPHFLFNSFNTLLELIETDQQRAAHHVDRLSTFFRNMLLVRDKELITLEEELKLLHTYFDLEKLRFGSAIDLLVDIPMERTAVYVVPLTLQMLVENALKHNTAIQADPLKISVLLAGNELMVENTIRPRRSAVRSTGFGLDSITKRYAALSVRRVRVESAEGRFRVFIPLITSHEHPDR